MNNLQIQALEEEQETLVKRLAEIRRLLPPFNQRHAPRLVTEGYNLSYKDVHEKYGISISTIKKWVIEERLSSIQVFEKRAYQVRVNQTELEAFLKERQAQSAH